MEHNYLKTIDFSCFSIETDEKIQLLHHRAELESMGEQLLLGFANQGFVYIRNHGITKHEDEEYFDKTSLLMHTTESFTTLRLLNYPPMRAGGYEEGNGSIRCGEHSDYGTITLLFQDDIGGLEVKTRSGDYLQAKPIPDTIVVNVGNILEHMTAGKLMAARHRVLLDGHVGLKTRKSIAFFVHPDHNVPVQRLQQSQDENPLSAYDFVKKNFDETYNI